MIDVHVSVSDHVILTRIDALGNVPFALTWPEANELQAKIRQLLIDNGITMRDVM